MSKKFIVNLRKIELLQTKTIQKHEDMGKYLENIDYESLNGTSKVAIEISILEEIARQVSEVLLLEKEKKYLISTFSCVPKTLSLVSTSLSDLKHKFKGLKSKMSQQASDLKSDFKKLSNILKEYKERCRNTLLYYLKTLDHDLRKILKPLVPSAVLNDQIKFPNINKNASLLSSLAPSKNNSGRVHSHAEENKGQRPDSPEKLEPKGGNHVDLLVNTLEKVAKDLIIVLTEANSQYYDVLNNNEVCSQPQTPLAAPLPEYFVYETEESDVPVSNKIIIKEDAQTWIRRFNDLFTKGIISSNIYSSIIEKVNPLRLRGCKIDLQDIYKELDISADLKESITFALVNKSAIEQHDVTLMDLLTIDKSTKQEKCKPEPPKGPNTNPKPRAFLVKNQKRSFDADKSEQEANIYASVDYQSELEIHRQSPVPRQRLSSFRERISNKKSTLIDKSNNHLRVRSVTPVYTFKEKISTLNKSKAKATKKK